MSGVKPKVEIDRDKEFALEFSGNETDLHQRLVLKDLRNPKNLPLAVDFLEPKLLHRLKQGLGRQQPFAKALGPSRTGEPSRAKRLLDLTAGLGVDAFFAAALGFEVVAVERSPVIYALLEDGLRRLRDGVEEEPTLRDQLQAIAGRLEFVNDESTRYLKERASPDTWPHVIYLDPMYPDEGRSESALPKKAMQMFRRLVGDDLDADEVFALAIQKARERVVVKRPLRAPWLSHRKPTHSFSGKTARYDMYHVAT